MLRTIVIAVLVVGLLVGGYFLWQRHTADGELGSGDVVARHVAPDDSATATTTDLDGSSNGALPTPSRSDAPGTINTVPVGSDPNAPASVPAPAAATATTGASGTMRAPDANYGVATPPALPVSDSIAPNPPNGQVFTGTGAYQWYRQGNITWRVDSKNGHACIAFATMDEWTKPLVLSNGCGRIV